MGAMVNLTYYVLYQMKYHFTSASNLYSTQHKGVATAVGLFYNDGLRN